MANIWQPRQYPGSIRELEHARNGKVVDWRLLSKISRRLNYTLAHQRKCVFSKTVDPISIIQSVEAQQVPWRWAFRSGEASTTAAGLQLVAIGCSIPPDTTTSGTEGADPQWRFAAVGGGTTNSDYATATSVVAAPAIDDLTYSTLKIAISPDTAYNCHVEIEDRCRLLSLMVYEEHRAFVNDADSITTPRSEYYYGNQITDAQHTKAVVDNPHKLWKHNASHLFNLVPESEGGFWTRADAAYRNILDQTVSTVSASTPGWNTQVQYYNPFHTNDVTVVFNVFAKHPADPGGGVRLQDSGGTIAELTSFSAAGEWKSTTGVLDGSNDLHKIDVQLKGDGEQQITVEAVSVYVYDA